MISGTMKTLDLMTVISYGGTFVRFDSNNRLGELAGYIDENECVIFLGSCYQCAETTSYMQEWCKVLSKYGVVWCLTRRLKVCQ